ncbi:hypothetical protein BT69DRAFT_1236513 [Atractiella rhizophila]|nr:hypothetical protein BT69DRAFT_1236513 [Atractiella rhizophila]
MPLLLLLQAFLVNAQSETSFPSYIPSVVVGSGPSAIPVSSSVAPGTWEAGGSVTVSGTVLPPPSMTGMGRQAQINSATDFCLFLPPNPDKENLVQAEADAVAYCFNPYNETRPFPDGFITRAHFRRAADYVQVSGTYDWARMNLNPYDCGGEYDNHGPDGVGNPVGAHIDGGQDFFQFLGHCDIPGVGTFVIRSCFGDQSYPYCRNTFDLMGGLWVAPGDYNVDPGWTNCDANADLPVGVYNDSYTFAQGQSVTPTPVTAPASSNCVETASPVNKGVTYYFEDNVSGIGSATGKTGSTGGPKETGGSGSGGSGSNSAAAPSGGVAAFAVMAVAGMVVGVLAIL